MSGELVIHHEPLASAAKSVRRPGRLQGSDAVLFITAPSLRHLNQQAGQQHCYQSTLKSIHHGRPEPPFCRPRRKVLVLQPHWLPRALVPLDIPPHAAKCSPARTMSNGDHSPGNPRGRASVQATHLPCRSDDVHLRRQNWRPLAGDVCRVSLSKGKKGCRARPSVSSSVSAGMVVIDGKMWNGLGSERAGLLLALLFLGCCRGLSSLWFAMSKI